MRIADLMGAWTVLRFTSHVKEWNLLRESHCGGIQTRDDVGMISKWREHITANVGE